MAKVTAQSRHTQSSKRKGPASRSGSQRGPIAVTVSILAVAAVLVAFLLIKLNSSSTSPTTGERPVPSSVLNAIEHVPTSALNSVGYNSSVIPPLVTLSGQTPLMNSGKPELLYIGAEYCPFCAAERWPTIVALSRFGHFSNLHLMTSSATDSFPNTPTFSFYKSTYSSPYLSFVPVEWATNKPTSSSNNFSGYSILQTPTKSELALFQKYDTSPYTTQAGSIPFLDFGNRFLQIGASYQPQILDNSSWATIAGSLSIPQSQTAQAIDATANLETAGICAITHNQPGSVCDYPTIAKIEATIKG